MLSIYNTYQTKFPLPYDLDVLRIPYSSELIFCLQMNSTIVTNLKLYRLEYNEQEGINAGGIRRNFFTNLEKQINFHIEIKKKLSKLEKDKNEFKQKIHFITEYLKKITHKSFLKNKTKHLKKDNKNYLKEEDLIKKKLYGNIVLSYTKLHNLKNKKQSFINDINLQIETEKQNYDEHMRLFDDTNKLIQILAFSKKYRLPIFINNEILKKEVLKILVNNQETSHKKLLYTFLFNKKGELLIPSSININDNININTNLESVIKKYIICNIYKNILDFYISHFFNFTIYMNDILEKLSFIDSNNNIQSILFQKKFRILLKSFDKNETKLFNIVLTGGSLLESNYYIHLKTCSSIKLPEVHTCYNTMDIFNYKSCPYTTFSISENNILNKSVFDECKQKFIEILNIIITSGFGIA